MTQADRHVVILAPMPLEMNAIVTAFGLSPASDEAADPGRAGSATRT